MNRSSRTRSLGVTALLAVFLLFFQIPFLSPQDNPNTSVRMMLTAAIVNDGTTRIDPYHEATVDKAFHDGHYYSDKAPGMGLMAIPAYVLGQAVLDTPDTFLPLEETTPARQLVFRLMVLSTSGVLCILAALAFYRMAEMMTGNSRAGLLATLTVFIGTPMLGWSVYFFGHAAAAACLITAFALIYRIVPEQGRGQDPAVLSGCAGVFLGLAVTFEYTAAPVVAMIGLYGIWQIRVFARSRAFGLLGIALLACIVSVIPMMIYHTVTFGGPFTVGYANLEGFEGMKEGFLGLTSPSLKKLYHLSFGMRRGLIWLAPVVLLVPVAMVMALYARCMVPEILLSGFIILYYYLLNASYHYWGGGASLGPRHVTPALPFMGVALIYLWWKATGFLRYILYVLSAVGIVISIMSASTTMTAQSDLMYPLLDPVLSGFLDGFGAWAFYEKTGVPAILAFSIWVVGAGFLFAQLWIASKGVVRVSPIRNAGTS